jgi:hypothetical protein
MSKVKDKLSANIRAVKAGQEPAAGEPAKATSEKPAARPAAKKTTTTTTTTRKPAKSEPARAKTTVPGDVPESGTALFPARVWPD